MLDKNQEYKVPTESKTINTKTKNIINKINNEILNTPNVNEIELDDYILQNILISIESGIDSLTKDEVLYSIDFITKKIEYITKLQKTFNLRNVNNRFHNIDSYLDMLTLQKNNITILSSLQKDVSNLLDILHLTLNILLTELNKKDINDN